MSDDILKGRYDYTPNTQPAVGISASFIYSTLLADLTARAISVHDTACPSVCLSVTMCIVA